MPHHRPLNTTVVLGGATVIIVAAVVTATITMTTTTITVRPIIPFTCTQPEATIAAAVAAVAAILVDPPSMSTTFQAAVDVATVILAVA